ncbi:MAG: peptide ABC transporter permease [Ignavibacteria bacterium GWA2_35_9]|nr:MAG: peptide ABC transporter permease [Ignavibacteria bacterium GWA2_35_9]OGU43698.1 MAG: peptide ABC transporter permease [Ignavibacteria bacterium GWB2_36_8]
MKILQLIILALQSLKTNRLRTLLTILGVVVGIFSIIVIMTIISMLQSTIEDGFQFLSKNTFEIRKWPAIHTGGHDSWEKYRNRKDITLDDYYRFEEMMKEAKIIGGMQGSGGKIVKFGHEETNPNIYCVGVTQGVYSTLNLEIEEGREFRNNEIEYSADVCVLGYFIVEKLFYNVDPIGKTVRMDGKPLRVIGTIKKRPEIFGQSQDNYIVIPITTFQSFYGRRTSSVDITVMTHSKEDYFEMIESATGHMRKIRKIKPGEENDFDIFSNESVMGQVNDITGGIKIGAMVVSIIALLAAGVGIMNIMLVSVTERTREIGIRKAVGARKTTILLQFLIEAIILCTLGGFIGIILGVTIGNFAGSFLSAQSAIPYDWVAIGLLLCVTVGVIFGTYPAYKAANLDPIEALRYE